MSDRFEAELWEWESRAAWFFVSLPFELSDRIEARMRGYERGFGSLRVQARVGATVWRTSIFPDGGRRTYVLPIKRQVREREGLLPGRRVAVEIELVD